MKPLPLNLRKNGFNYTQVLRGKRSCIYMQRYSEKTKQYEVFLIKERQARELWGKILPASEIFPNNEAFGRWAWAYNTFDRAKEKFDELES